MASIPDYRKLIKQLDSDDLSVRWDAVVMLARLPVHDGFYDCWQAIERRIDSQQSEQLSSIMAIALSMITARNAPHGSMFGGPVPDFLVTYEEYMRGVQRNVDAEDLKRLLNQSPFDDDNA